MVEEGIWYGAKEARGVADAYAAAMLIPSGDPDERIPLWHSVTKEVVMGQGGHDRIVPESANFRKSSRVSCYGRSTV